MKAPEDLNLSPEEGESLIERLEHDTCTPEDRQMLVQVLRLYFWLLFALQESKLSLKRLRHIIFGKPKKRRKRDADADGDSATSERGKPAEGFNTQNRHPNGKKRVESSPKEVNAT